MPKGRSVIASSATIVNVGFLRTGGPGGDDDDVDVDVDDEIEEEPPGGIVE